MKVIRKSFSLMVMCVIFMIGTSDAVNPGVNKSQAPDKDINEYIENLLSNEYVEDEIIVRFRDEVSDEASIHDMVHSKAGAVVKKKFRQLNGLHLVKIPEGKSLEQSLKTYLQDPDIKYAEPNYIVHATATPNDPSFTNLWGLHNTGQTGGTPDADIDAPEAWDIATGSDSVVIAVIDSGVAINTNISSGHPDVVSNVWTNSGETSCADGIDNDVNGYIDDCYGWDFAGNDNDPMDYNSHGTHVAGTIAAVGNNNQGISGVMWNASIMPLRFLDATGSGSTADAVSAILYANENGAHVINNSWGSSGYSQSLKDAIDASSAVVVCAAGNSGVNTDSSPFYPAAFNSANIISVAATDHNDNLAWFSNYGATSVDLAAPGVSIYSTIPARTELFFDNMSNLDNWTAQSPWGLSTTYYSSPYSAADSPGGNYADNVNVSLKLNNALNLSGSRGAVLEYLLRLETESSYDFFCIDRSLNGNAWSNLICYSGSTGGYFYFMEEDITAYDGQNKFYFRFRLDSDGSYTYDGAYIDNVRVTVYSDTYNGTEYAWYQGTSMAAPHVAGVAGLIKSYNPALTNIEIKDAILNNADTRSSLSGKTLTGGRLNAYNALNSLACPYLPVKIYGTSLYYSTIQAAYDAAVSGDRIMSRESTFIENLAVSANKTVTLDGGYDCSFNAKTGASTINGDMIISDGTLIVEDFVVGN